MKKLFYPALFQIARNGSFRVSFPDIPECHTQGEDLAQAYEKAVEALGLVLAEYDKEGDRFRTVQTPGQSPRGRICSWW